MKFFKHHPKKFFTLHKKRVKRIRRLGKHPFVVPVVTFLVLFSVTIVGYIALNGHTALPSDAHIVELTVDGKQRTVPTRVKTVGDLLSKLDITLGKNDVVEPAPSTPIQEDYFRVNVYRAQPVVIVDGATRTHGYSAASTPRTIARQVGVTVYPEDKAVTEPIDNVLRDGIGEKIVVTRSVPIVLNLYGTAAQSRSLAKTVGGVLEEKNIKLAPGDSVHPAESTAVKTGEQIFVLRKGTKMQTAREQIPVPVQKVNDNSLSYGTTAVRQAGSPGIKVVTYITSKNKKQKIQEVIVQNPVPQIIAVGSYINIPGNRTGLMASAGISQGQYAAVNYIVSRESNWNPASRNSSGCIGLGQSCGGGLAGSCPNWEFDPVCQLKFFSGYANGRYGSWSGAYSFWQTHGYW